MAEYFRKALENNAFATYDDRAFESAEVVVVDVNLDVEKHTDLEATSKIHSMAGFKKAIETIGSRCREDVLRCRNNRSPRHIPKIVKLS